MENESPTQKSECICGECFLTQLFLGKIFMREGCQLIKADGFTWKKESIEHMKFQYGWTMPIWFTLISVKADQITTQQRTNGSRNHAATYEFESG